MNCTNNIPKETWLSGRKRLTANEVGSNRPHGFESHRLRKKVKSVSVGSCASLRSSRGGRGEIPPSNPPFAPPAFLLAFFGIFVTNAKGARGEKTSAPSRTSGFEPTF